MHSDILTVSRRYRADGMFHYKALDGQWSMNTVNGRCILLDGDKYARTFANERYFSKIFSMFSKAKAGDVLRVFCRVFCVPYNLTFDDSKEQCDKGTIFMQ